MAQSTQDIVGENWSGFIPGARALLAIMPTRRRLYLLATLAMMFVGAIAELVTIGAVLPMLAIAADADYAAKIPALANALDLFGVAPGGNLIVPAALFLIAAASIAACIRLALTWMTHNLVFGIQYDVTTRAYGRVLRQPYDKFVKQNSSAAISGIEKAYIVTTAIVSPVILAITSAGIAIFIIAFLFFIDPVAAAFASVSMAIVYLFITLSTRRILMSISARFAAIRTARVQLLQESLGSIRDIILDHSHDVFDRKLATYERELRRLQVRSSFIATSPRFVVEGCGIILVALLAIYFSWQPGGILAAIPVLGALALGAQRLLPLLQAVYLGWASYSVHAHTFKDVLELVNLPISTVRSLGKDDAVKPFQEAIELKQVAFSYDGNARSLNDVDLVIRKGERVALIGKTGSGKSTLVDLLMGLLRPTEGAFLLDGVPVDDDNMGNWHAQIAHVPQAIFLADDTIAANIAFGDDEVDLDRVKSAAQRADIQTFIERLPDGMMTKVGERGVRLSGGQRQRIGIARALYKNATVLVLDEATSALDDKTEAAVMKSVTSLDRDLTMILIAHRLSTVSACDTIYRLDEGRIVQKGSYAEVVGGAGEAGPTAGQEG